MARRPRSTEFYGNLYHLNAEEEPEEHDYPKNPAFKAKYGPRGVMDCKASTTDDKPFFLWVNFNMHLWTHTKPESLGQAGEFQSPYHDTMIDHDKNVGSVLDEIDWLGIAENTIVIYGTDNGPHMNAWPDGAMTPLRNEKNTGWEGGFRVPFMVRWPGRIKASTVSNEIMSNLDGYNFLPYLTGQETAGPRIEYFYFSDDGDLLALRHGNWKTHFKVQNEAGTLRIWQREFENLRLPYLFNLRTDPYERATITSNNYWNWYIRHVFLLVPAQEKVGEFLSTFKEYPPRQKAASFTVDQVLQTLLDAHGG